MNPLKNGTVTISGLARSDLRVIARAIGEGSYAGGDQGGPVSKALLRLEHLLLVPCRYDGLNGAVQFVGGTADAEDLYEEINPVTGEIWR